MQFNRDAHGKMSPLPKQSIDTGAGLERVISLKMDVDNLFLTDILRSIISEIEHVSGKKYIVTDTAMAPAFNVIADHMRCACLRDCRWRAAEQRRARLRAPQAAAKSRPVWTHAGDARAVSGPCSAQSGGTDG